MEKKIHKEQLIILNYIKSYTKKLLIKKINIKLVPFSDFVTWANCIGKQKIHLYKKNYLALVSKNFFLELFSIGKNHNFEIVGPKLKDNKKINVIYSYCEKSDFRDNFFFDKYFGVKSNQISNTYWFLISLDNFLPKRKYKNIFILRKKSKRFKFFFLLKTISQILKKKNRFII